MNQKQQNNKNNKGFTLIELLMVVAVVALLAAVGYPSYTAHVKKAKRKIVIGEILDQASHFERVKAQTFSYDGISVEQGDIDGYVLSLVQAAALGDINVPGYTIVATPDAYQSNDVCGTISYNNLQGWTFSTGRTLNDCR